MDSASKQRSDSRGDILRRFGRFHKTVHGDGANVLGRIVLTCEEMLRDRGCEATSRNDILASIEAGTPAVQARGGGVDVDVYIHCEDRIGVKFARAVLDECESAGTSALVVSIEGPTPFTRKECENRPVQFMLARELCYNVTHHKLVPKHERQDGPPPGVERKDLPRIMDTDSVVQYYGWPVGTVVKVWRVFGGDEPIPYYRVVCTAASS